MTAVLVAGALYTGGSVGAFILGAQNAALDTFLRSRAMRVDPPPTMRVLVPFRWAYNVGYWLWSPPR